ncbi:MAG TPA: pyridoxamine 5'-phosphate oxidase family protein [Acidimicrobiales bacterium]|nr:pyridoxamine 5'-phosphate oxidase family protein [Acidimicrobiales bacterium]
MALTTEQCEFIRAHPSAAMVTVAPDGVAKVARVGVTLVDGILWCSGTQSRVRTKRLRRDPRCTLFCFDDVFRWLALETRVTILDGPDALQQSVRLFRTMQKRPQGPLAWFDGELEEEAFLRAMVDEGRLIYQFEVDRCYGMTGSAGRD